MLSAASCAEGRLFTPVDVDLREPENVLSISGVTVAEGAVERLPTPRPRRESSAAYKELAEDR